MNENLIKDNTQTLSKNWSQQNNDLTYQLHNLAKKFIPLCNTPHEHKSDTTVSHQKQHAT